MHFAPPLFHSGSLESSCSLGSFKGQLFPPAACTASPFHEGAKCGPSVVGCPGCSCGVLLGTVWFLGLGARAVPCLGICLLLLC